MGNLWATHLIIWSQEDLEVPAASYTRTEAAPTAPKAAERLSVVMISSTAWAVKATAEIMLQWKAFEAKWNQNSLLINTIHLSKPNRTYTNTCGISIQEKDHTRHLVMWLLWNIIAGVKRGLLLYFYGYTSIAFFPQCHDKTICIVSGHSVNTVLRHRNNHTVVICRYIVYLLI